MEKLRLVIADDDALIRDGLKKILNFEPEHNIDIVGEASNGEEVVGLAREMQPDIVLMDINMPVLNGIEATKQIKESNPEINVIALTIHEDKEYLSELMDYEVSGYILKDTSANELLDVIYKVAAGEYIIDSRMTGKLVGEWRRRTEVQSSKEKLTERELEILAEIARGENNRTIAEKLFLSEKTVKNHISSILRKIEASDRTQAAIYAIKHNLVDS